MAGKLRPPARAVVSRRTSAMWSVHKRANTMRGVAVGSSRPADAAQVHQAVRASAQALERDIEDVADDLVGVLHQDIPELPSDARSQVATRRAAIESIHGLMRTVLRGAPVEA